MAIVIAAAGLLTYVSQTSSDPPVQLLAEASGLTPDEFRTEVADFWQLQEAVERVDGSIPGTITRTEPKAGAILEEGELVTFWVSQGNEMKTVPDDLIGLSLADATLFITGAELEVVRSPPQEGREQGPRTLEPARVEVRSRGAEGLLQVRVERAVGRGPRPLPAHAGRTAGEG